MRRRWPARVAMIGQRGVPATFGGIERHVEEVGTRLAERGHQVTVFCRPGYLEDPSMTEFRGMRLRTLPAPELKHFEAIVHSALSSGLSLGGRHDVVHYHAVGPALTAFLPRWLSRSKVVVTVHGLDGQRAKWGRAARGVLGTATWLSARVPDARIVVSRALQTHYRERYGADADWVTNGVTRPRITPPGGYLASLGLRPGRYALFVGRLVPEKAPDLLVRAFREIDDPEAQLVVVGGSSHTTGYTAELTALAAADPRVVLPGYVYGDDLAELYSNAGLFVLPSLVEGMPLTLLEAASYRLPVVASDIPPHVEVLQEDAPGRMLVRHGDLGDLVRALKQMLPDTDQHREAAHGWTGRVMAEHDWDEVVDRTERVYARLLGVSLPEPARVIDLAALETPARPGATPATGSQVIDLTAWEERAHTPAD